MELYRNDFGVISYDAGRSTLTIDWSEETARMNAEDFKDALERLAGHAEEHRARRVLVDVTRFRFQPPPEIGAWRDEHVVPRYNRAGVKRFAYVVSGEAPPAPEDDGAPAQGSPERFFTRVFNSTETALAWLSQS